MCRIQRGRRKAERQGYMNGIERITAHNAIGYLQKTPGKPYQTIREFKRNSGLSESYLRRLDKEGILPVFPVGNRHYVDVLRFEKYLETLSCGAEVYGK